MRSRGDNSGSPVDLASVDFSCAARETAPSAIAGVGRAPPPSAMACVDSMLPPSAMADPATLPPPSATVGVGRAALPSAMATRAAFGVPRRAASGGGALGLDSRAQQMDRNDGSRIDQNRYVIMHKGKRDISYSKYMEKKRQMMENTLNGSIIK